MENGWSGATTTVIAETAGVSRGAQLHHYPSKAAARRGRRRASDVDAEPPRCGPRRQHSPARAPDRIERVIDLLAASFTGPLFTATIEVWVAARTDDALREALVPLEATIGRELYRLAVDLLDADDDRAEVREAIQATLELLRGLGIANLLSDDSGRRSSVLRGWSQHLEVVLDGHRPMEE